MRPILFLAVTLLAACSDALEQRSSAGQVIGVVNATDRTLSGHPATGLTVSARDWQSGTATPAAIGGRGQVFGVAPGAADGLGVSPPLPGPPGALQLLGRPDYPLALPRGLGATGVVIQ